jgi:phospholipid/cholesterol/gamma-HCH transport system ATP-binding protein
MIKIENLSQKFNDKPILDNISLEIEKEKIHFIIGTSGTGKTVLVKHIIGLLKPLSGRILFENVDITKLKEREIEKIRKKITYIFQHSTLFDNLTLYQNIELPLIKNKTPKKNIQTLVDKYLKLVNIDDYRDKYPYEIGESIKKRTAIARGLAMNPEYIIYDEPTTGLSFSDARNIDNLIFNMSRELKATAIVISHDLKSIFSIADRITMLYKGSILLDGTIGDFKNSNNEIVKQFINAKSDGPI